MREVPLVIEGMGGALDTWFSTRGTAEGDQ